jgi:hypothetical protein
LITSWVVPGTGKKDLTSGEMVSQEKHHAARSCEQLHYLAKKKL